MIRHLLRLVWNRKRANALLMLEIFFSFLGFGILHKELGLLNVNIQPESFHFLKYNFFAILIALFDV